ncbi:MAG: hypothetical protein DMG57_15880 [Acidobacteria bacterium]|nr:MAG: hypothetical protein DMG57_15880 [Acidobacteriota bacterium]
MKLGQTYVLVLLLVFTLGIRPLGAAKIYERYALILSDPSAAEFASSHQNAPRSVVDTHRQRVEAQQDSLKQELARRTFIVSGSVSNVLNAIFVLTTPDRVSELRALPGVAAVRPLRRFRRLLDRAVQLMNGPAAWNAVGGVQQAGLGVRIAIIDTGIDQTHPAFQDNALPVPSGFPKCAPADCAFTNHKVIVARSYVKQLSAGTPPDVAATSRPDDNSARDRVGHGTAVAMAAAGETNSGPSGTITGMAPKAYLGSYKVFGSPGVNDFTTGDVVISAISDALNDGMQIAVLSLGSSAFGGPLDVGAACGETGSTPCDPEATAVENAVRSGMLVVAAAGNEGDFGKNVPTLGTIDSPGDAPSAIAAGATTNSHQFVFRVRLSGSTVPSNLQQMFALFSDGPLPASPLTAPLRDVAVLSSDPLGCSPMPASSAHGAIVLIERGNCNFAVKVDNVQNAGGVGVIFYQANTDDLIPPGGLTSTQIPAVLIGSTDGFALRSFVDAHPGYPGTLDPAFFAVDTPVFDTVPDFSSHGPSIVGAIKPELGAVGTDLYLAAERFDPNGALYSADGYTVSQGTSFSTPIVAGAAALVKQKHPNYTTAQLKSAIVNTANQGVTDASGTARVNAVGAGKLDAGAAVSSTVTVAPATASFGFIKTVPVSQQLQITNTGTSAGNLSLSFSPRDQDAHGHLSLDKTALALGPGQSDVVTVTLSGPMPAPGSYEGSIVIQGGATPVHIPYLYVVGDGNPFDIVALLGDGFDGTVNQQIPEGAVVFQVTDRFGAPVANVPVQFSAATGGGSIQQPDARTDSYGLAGATAILGPKSGPQEFAGQAGGLSIKFDGTARLDPAITPKGAVNAASFQVGQGQAPGSYISLFGAALSDDTRAANSASLPLAIDFVSVSFDVPSAGISLPGRLYYVSPSQINLQVPWELRGQTSALIKVAIEDSQGPVYTLPLADYSPAFFTYTEGGTNRLLLAARDLSGKVISSSNPARRGQSVSLFANGLGPVDNQPPTGEPAPLSPLAHTLSTPTVSIATQQATVGFSGLAPLYSGLYQMNVTVPANIPAGVQQVQMSINGVTAPAANLPVQ